jgi:threonine dehydrogenase-like Zn-dependent dehydrogenase
MKTTALRIFGKKDLRLETFDLPEMKDDEILAEVITNSICMSCHKAAMQGPDHKRVPKDVAVNPTIIGHEFAGRLVKVGAKWAKQFKAGDLFSIQPALAYKGSLEAPGYSFRWIGGNATHVLIPSCVMEMNCLLPYRGEGFFKASLSEPMSCIVGAAHAQYHTKYGSYVHEMGIVKGGTCAILAGAGPMGMGCIDYLVNGPRQPKLLVVTDIDDARLARAAELMTVEHAKSRGVTLVYKNTKTEADPVAALKALAGGDGFDDLFVFAPVAPVVEQADAILGRNGCLNFFAGPTDPKFSAKFNFYNVHYAETHIVGTSGGNTDDMRESLELMSAGKINPAAMITHIGGITAAKDTTLRLNEIPGGKKLIYTHLDFPLIAIQDLAASPNPLFSQLGAICQKHGNLWNVEAERHLMANGPQFKG